MFVKVLLLVFAASSNVVVNSQYVQPPWWTLVSTTFSVDNLKRCFKHDGVIKPAAGPTSGDACSSSTKTCFFEDQVCAGVAYPKTKCVCVDGIWGCNAVACPIEASVCPTKAELESPEVPTCNVDGQSCMYSEVETKGIELCTTNITCTCDGVEYACGLVGEEECIPPAVPVAPPCPTKSEIDGGGTASMCSLIGQNCTYTDVNMISPVDQCTLVTTCNCLLVEAGQQFFCEPPDVTCIQVPFTP